MKITKSHLDKIIKEELTQVIKEFDMDAFDADTGAGESEDIQREAEEDFANYMKILFSAFHNIATDKKASVMAAMNLQENQICLSLLIFYISCCLKLHKEI